MTAFDAIRPAQAPHQVPGEVNHRLLRAEGQDLAARRPRGGEPGRCGDSRCAEPFPCRGRRLADDAMSYSTTECHRIWTARVDLRSSLVLIGCGTGAEPYCAATGRAGARQWRGGDVR